MAVRRAPFALLGAACLCTLLTPPAHTTQAVGVKISAPTAARWGAALGDFFRSPRPEMSTLQEIFPALGQASLGDASIQADLAPVLQAVRTAASELLVSGATPDHLAAISAAQAAPGKSPEAPPEFMGTAVKLSVLNHPLLLALLTGEQQSAIPALAQRYRSTLLERTQTRVLEMISGLSSAPLGEEAVPASNVKADGSAIATARLRPAGELPPADAEQELRQAFTGLDARAAERALLAATNAIARHEPRQPGDWRSPNPFGEWTRMLETVIGDYWSNWRGETRNYAIERKGGPMLAVKTQSSPPTPARDHDDIDPATRRIEVIRYPDHEYIGHNDHDSFIVEASLPPGSFELWTPKMRESLLGLLRRPISRELRNDLVSLLLLTSPDPARDEVLARVRLDNFENTVDWAALRRKLERLSARQRPA